MITLCVLFNHAYPKNIPLLRRLLSGRFSDLVFIQPILRSGEPDVFTGYRGSYNFQGLVSDQLEMLMARESEHYVFIQDDVFLNPTINEHNIIEKLGLVKDGAFLTQFNAAGGAINGPGYRGWNWIVGVLWKLMYPTNTICGSGVQSFHRDFAELAGRTQELERKYGMQFPPFTYDPHSPPPFTDPFGGDELSDELTQVIFRGLFKQDADPKLNPPLALCVGFSDFFVVDASILERAAHMFGVFAAANIFAEVAIPTTLMHVADRVVQACDIGMRANWSYTGADSVESLIDGFKTDLLVAHPVKPSVEHERLLEVAHALEAIRA